MNQAEKNDDEFDVERLRKQVSEIRTISTEETSAGKRPSQPVELNEFAKRVAAQFRDEKFSPAMMTGLFRLVDFLLLFVIGCAISFGYVQEDRVMPVYTLTIAAGEIPPIVPLWEIPTGARSSRSGCRRHLLKLRMTAAQHPSLIHRWRQPIGF